MKHKLPIIIGGTMAAVGASSVLAFADTTTNGTGQDGLASKIASAFHLNQADVQKVIDQNRTDRQAQMEQKYEDRLAQAVTDGKITSDQKTLILAKHKEVVSFMESLKGKTAAERKSAMQTERQQLQDWASQNNIDLKWIMPMHRGFGMGHFDGSPDDTSPSSATSSD